MSEAKRLEGAEILAQLVCGASREFRRAGGQFRALFHLAHALSYHAAPGLEMLDHSGRPLSQLFDWLGWLFGKRTGKRAAAGVGDRLLKQRLLRAEITENRHFVDLGCVCYAPGGRSAESVL